MIRTIHLLTICSIILCIYLVSGVAIANNGHHHAENESSQALLSKIWWNQANKLEKIALTEDQRGEMDQALMHYLEEYTTHLKTQKEAFKELGMALSNGNSELAALQRDKLSNLTSESVQQQINIMIEVVGIMTEEQRAILTAEYPLLLSRLWIRSANPAALQLGRRERKGKR